MEIVFTPAARQDLDFWRISGHQGIQQRITALLQDMRLHPYSGIGKPERLKYNYAGYWSRRITQEHRIIYKIEEEQIIVISCRFHY